MKILLFGGAGQLGLEIQKRKALKNANIIAPLEQELDITNLQKVASLVSQVNPEVIINAAAYTAVDNAEDDTERAYCVNRDGVAVLAEAAKKAKAKFIHISTDYVFDGSAEAPIKEEDPVNPLGIYGKSKLEGEKRLQEIYPDNSLIVRTSSLHGQFGGNFVHTMIKLFEEREEIEVVNDQWMSPTWAGWLAEILLDLCEINTTAGVLHASCAGGLSWYEFALAIQELTGGQLRTSIKTTIKPVSADIYKRPAPRPRYSVFDCSRLGKVLGRKPIPWLNGLKNHLNDIGYSVD
ncbi:MAG: dTDP-4-dehydrorhamnose reductase [SAR324 cluster bacterium]|uniref:dTDP-4-dehydrorhamnose reductase n=1 Tax=SAR324 cluster bacterium TaxID=2024889 RepID=A0A7X9IL40_9DELT|nr:dTDP-4-dehydrorhamnose reductase [SAR324 cluster bacterium]